MYFPSKCVIKMYLSKCINHAIIWLVQYHNRLWVLYLNCTRGYLQFDMLVAMVSVRNYETNLFRTVSADDKGSSIIVIIFTSVHSVLFFVTPSPPPKSVL